MMTPVCIRTRYVFFLLVLMAANASAETSTIDANNPDANTGARQILQEAIHQEEALGDVTDALDLYARAIAAATDAERGVAAIAQLRLGLLYERLRREAEAENAFAAVVTEYADQHDVVRQAQAKIAARASNSAKSGIAARRVWGGPGVDLEGAPSPDGSYLTYTDWSTGDLAIRILADGAGRRLTDKGSWQDSQQYAGGSIPSPDGKLVAYGWNNADMPGAGFYELRIIGVDGSGLRVLYRNPAVGYVVPHAWSPDGTQILAMFVREDETSQIVMVSLADGSVRVLKSIDWRWSNNRMQVSPDGKHIVYDFPPAHDAPERDLLLLATDASREVVLVEHPANDQSPIWTPDGRTVLFASDRTGVVGLWAIDVTEGAPSGSARLVRNQMGPFTPLGFSTPGSYYYGRATGRKDFYTATFDPDTGRLLASPVKLAQRFEGTSRLPAWSPDGQHLAYVRALPGCAWEAQAACSADDVLVIRSVATGAERSLHPDLRLIRGIRWSPGGDWLLLTGIGPQRRPGIYRFELENGSTTRLVRTAIHEVNPGTALPAVSPDGATMYHVRLNMPSGVAEAQEEDRILAHDISTREEREIYRAPANTRIMGLTLSLDGQQLAVAEVAWATLSASVKAMPAAGGDARELYTSSGFISTVGWSADSLLVQTEQSPPGSELWRISLDGGAPVRVDLPSNIPFYGRNVSVNPDGRQIVFSAGQQQAEVWVLENILAALEAAE